ncbi:efflux RND transporter periplasmic adaptor subunit [Arachidicoccus ginsenosidivorans]
MRRTFLLTCWVVIWMAGCKSGGPGDAESSQDGVVGPAPVAVTITAGSFATLTDSTQLSAVSTYLREISVKNDLNGYIQQIGNRVGDKVLRGQRLFTVQTKESKNIGNLINQLDASFQFSGMRKIKSPVTGYITTLNHQAGDYVQEGEALATIADDASFGFTLNLPFEYNDKIRLHQPLTIHLPDGSSLEGRVERRLPQMDSASQTEQIFIKTIPRALPANLMGTVYLTAHSFTGFLLPTASIYSDESKQHFWVFQLTSDSTARKIPVAIGLENGSQTGIATPKFSDSDRFVLDGGYGLGDRVDIRITTQH